jgi:hypothetical protein
MKETRRNVRAVILGVTAFFCAFLVIRLFLQFFDVSESAPIWEFLYQFSDLLLEPIAGSSSISITDVLLGLLVYATIGIFISEFIVSFLYDSVILIIRNVVDAIFKIIESLLFLRFIFDLFEVSFNGSFVDAIYSATDWADGIIDTGSFLPEQVNTSILLALIIVVILDIVSDGILTSLSKIGRDKDEPRRIKKTESTGLSQPSGSTVHQNITINVPSHHSPQYGKAPSHQHRPDTIGYEKPMTMPYDDAQHRNANDMVVQKKDKVGLLTRFKTVFKRKANKS